MAIGSLEPMSVSDLAIGPVEGRRCTIRTSAESCWNALVDLIAPTLRVNQTLNFLPFQSLRDANLFTILSRWSIVEADDAKKWISFEKRIKRGGGTKQDVAGRTRRTNQD